MSSTTANKNGNSNHSATTFIRIELPEHIYTAYEQQAAESDKDIADLLVQRLVESKDQSSYQGRSVRITPDQRQQLEKAFGRSFLDGADLVHYLMGAYTLRIGELQVALSPEVLRRLQSRAGRLGFDRYVTEQITRQLEHIVGMR